MTGPASRTERLAALSRRVSVRPVVTVADQEEVAALRYRAYRAAGMIGAIPGNRIWDDHDNLPNARCVGVWRGATLIASIRLHVAEAANLGLSPAVSVFPDILEPQLASGARILDPNRLTVGPIAQREEPDVHMLLMRISMSAAIHHAVDIVTATIRPGHKAFYARWLHMSWVADPSPYPPLLRALGLMTAQFQRERDAVLDKADFLRPESGEPKRLFGQLAEIGDLTTKPEI
jgi:hypothetical protein